MSRPKKASVFRIITLLTLCLVLGGLVFSTASPAGNVYYTRAPALGLSGVTGSYGPADESAKLSVPVNPLLGADSFSAPAAAPTTTTASASFSMEAPARAAYEDLNRLEMKVPAAGGAGDPTLSYGSTAPSTYQSPLTAGQVDDNAEFAEYVTYIHDYRGPQVVPIPVEQRLFVRVLDADQHPVAGARVELFDGQRRVFDGRTTSDGRVLFFPQWADAAQAQQLRAVISRGQQQAEATVPVSAGEQSISLPKPADNSGPVGLDIVFLLDATGSMGDEIGTIKATIDSIASRIEQLPGSSAPRFGLVAYRDHGDEYVTRAWDFGDVQQFSANLAQVEAGGGGDYPEAVSAGLQDAINLPGWANTDSGRHLRLVILVGDAPPQLKYANDPQYPALLQAAVAAGIKIFPIGASGLEDQGEYIFRQFAQVTQGQFVFLTYANGVSGAPGPATDKHVSEFSVNNLDSLVVKLVAQEIANQTGQSIQTSNPQPAPVANNIITAAPAAPNHWAKVWQDVSAWATDWSGVIWAVILGLGLIWMRRRGAQRARVASSAAAPLPPAPAMEVPWPGLARVSEDRRAAAWAAPVAPAGYPVDPYLSVPFGGAAPTPAERAAGRSTAPLPPLPEDVTRRIV